MSTAHYYRLGETLHTRGTGTSHRQRPSHSQFVDAPASKATLFCARPAGRALLAALAPGDEVAIAHVDSLGRNIRAILCVIARISERGVILKIEDFFGTALDTSCEHGQTLLRIVRDLADRESRLRSERIREARVHRLAAGYGVTAHPPLGYCYKPSKELNQRGRPVMLLVPNVREQRWVYQILRWQAEGYSLPAIHRMLRRHRVRCFSWRRLRSHFEGAGRRRTIERLHTFGA